MMRCSSKEERMKCNDNNTRSSSSRVVLCLSIIRGVFVLHFVPHFSRNEYKKCRDIRSFSLSFTLSDALKTFLLLLLLF